MAEQLPEILAASLKGLRLELRAGQMGSKISDFSGESSRRFNQWIRDIELTGLAVEASDSVMRSLTVQSVKGQAAEFVARLVSEDRNISWNELKARLIAQYSDESEREIAVQRLRRMKQNKGETIQCFGERIRRTALDAYPGQNINNPVISEVLVNSLIDGCIQDRIAQKLLRSRPDSFDAALTLAIREQQTNKLFEMRRREEPMEVDAVAAAKIARAEETAVLEKLVARLEALEKTEKPKPSNSRYQKPPKQNFKPDNKWTEDGRPICNYCSRVGHTWRECRRRLSNESKHPHKLSKN